MQASQHVAYWPKASVRCVAVIRPELGVKQTCRHRSNDAIDPTRPSGKVRWKPENAFRLTQMGETLEPTRRLLTKTSIVLPTGRTR